MGLCQQKRMSVSFRSDLLHASWVTHGVGPSFRLTSMLTQLLDANRSSHVACKRVVLTEEHREPHAPNQCKLKRRHRESLIRGSQVGHFWG